MNKLKKLSAVVTAILMLSFTGCNKSADSSSVSEADSSSQSITADTVANSSEAETNSTTDTNSEYFDADDLDTSFDNPDAEIVLNGSSADIKGNGADFADRKISISSGGTYVFSGTLDDGQIYVSTKEKVHIVLNGVNISCSDSSPVFIEDSDNAVITVCGENSLTDSANYVYETADENEPDAVIYSKDDLSVNGSGTLNLTANYNEGLASKNDLRISGITLNVTSVGNSVKGKDSLAVMDAVITADSQSDGMKSSNAEENDKGYIAIESGKFNITAAQDAVQAETDLIVNGGTFNIKTGSGAGNTGSENAVSDNQMFGGRGGMIAEGNANQTEDSEKGLKAGRSLIINDGNITANCADDTLHSNETAEINGGTLNLSSGDDGIHAGSQLDINSGEITILKSYEGIESTVININDGTIHLTASDDGFNASEGSSDIDTAAQFGGGMGGGFGDVSENCILNINGGYIYVDAGGDGLDSNGVMNINGGTTLVDGPVNDGNGALDSGTEINVNGGILIAAGSSGMAETPSDTSTQYSVAVSFEQSQEAGSLVSLQDENGNSIITYSPSKTYSSVIISTPEIKQDGTYSVYYGGSCSGTETDGLYSGGNYSGGTLLETVTASSAVTQAGTGMLGTMGGGKGGGMGGRKDFMQDGSQDFQGEMPENMTPPDGNENGMTPPDGFGNGMTPPDGFGHGGMTPPDMGSDQSSL